MTTGACGCLDRRPQRTASERAWRHEHVRIALDALELDAASVDVDLGVADTEPERTRDGLAVLAIGDEDAVVAPSQVLDPSGRLSGGDLVGFLAASPIEKPVLKPRLSERTLPIRPISLALSKFVA